MFCRLFNLFFSLNLAWSSWYWSFRFYMINGLRLILNKKYETYLSDQYVVFILETFESVLQICNIIKRLTRLVIDNWLQKVCKLLILVQLFLLIFKFILQLLQIMLLMIDLTLLPFDVPLLNCKFVLKLLPMCSIPLKFLRFFTNFLNHLFLTDSVVFSFNIKFLCIFDNLLFLICEVLVRQPLLLLLFEQPHWL